MIPVEDTAHVKAVGSTIVRGALTMGRAGVLGPGPTAERKKQSNSSFVKSTFKKAEGEEREEQREEEVWRVFKDMKCPGSGPRNPL